MYLLFVEDGSEAVEELEGGEDLALDEQAGEDCGGCPDSGDDGHLEEPCGGAGQSLGRYFHGEVCGHTLLQRHAVAQHRRHDCPLMMLTQMVSIREMLLCDMLRASAVWTTVCLVNGAWLFESCPQFVHVGYVDPEARP